MAKNSKNKVSPDEMEACVAPHAATKPAKGKNIAPAKPVFPTLGFLNKKGRVPPPKAIDAVVVPSPATNALEKMNVEAHRLPSNPRVDCVSRLSSNPRVRQQGSLIDGATGNFKAPVVDSIVTGTGLDNVRSDDNIGLIDSDQIETPTVDATPGKKGWASLFGSNRMENNGFKLKETIDGVTDNGVFLDNDDIQPDAK